MENILFPLIFSILFLLILATSLGQDSPTVQISKERKILKVKRTNSQKVCNDLTWQKGH